MRLENDNGTVALGIGTTAPTAQLHVVGTGLFTGLVSGITPVAAANFVTKAYVDGSGGGTGPFLPLAGGTLSGNLNMHNAGSPTLSIKDTTNNVDLKLYSQNSDSHIGTYSDHPLVFDTNSTETMRITSAGNVGIGTTSPTNGKLVIDSTANQIAIETGTAGDGRLNIGHFSNGTFIGTYGDDGGAADLIRFGTHSGDERMRIDSSGILLINSTSTAFSDKLYVNGDAYTTGGWRVGTAGTYVGKLINNGGILTLMSDGTRDVQIGNDGNPSMLYVDTSAGNVGIGTTSPYKKLEVVGDLQLDASNANMWIKSGATGTNGFINWTFNSDDTVYNKIGIDYDTRASTGFHIDTGYPLTLDCTTYIDFKQSGGTLGRWNSTGLGIGTTSPAVKFEISESGAGRS
jgi:hypothetical protein